MALIYSNGNIRIESEKVYECEFKILVNGETFIWVSEDTLEDFKKELTEVLDKHRI